MAKEVKFEVKTRPNYRSDDVTLTLIERGYRNRITSKRTFTVKRWDLERALKQAGLFESVEVPTGDTKLMAEIAWYQAQLGRTGGTPSADSIRNKLWNRINKKLGLS